MDKHIITIRRGKVEREIEQLKSQLDILLAELKDLEIAERVIDRLLGPGHAPTNTVGESKQPELVKGTAEGGLTIREMIKAALMDARQRGLPGRTPNQIRQFIASVYGRDLGQQINTTAYRMWRDIKEINKDEITGLFSLPGKEKPSDNYTVAGSSEGLFDKPEAKGREAGPGGGT